MNLLRHISTLVLAYCALVYALAIVTVVGWHLRHAIRTVYWRWRGARNRRGISPVRVATPGAEAAEALAEADSAGRRVEAGNGQP